MTVLSLMYFSAISLTLEAATGGILSSSSPGKKRSKGRQEAEEAEAEKNRKFISWKGSRSVRHDGRLRERTRFIQPSTTIGRNARVLDASASFSIC